LTDTEGLARLLLRAEAVASSRIEGLEAGPRRVLRAEAAISLGEASLDVTADDILGNIRAMQFALKESDVAGPLTVDTLLRIHRELLRGTQHEHLGGVIRTEQNWIGGTNYNPCSAVFVPPPPEHV
jgi:Fic family protein